MTYTEQREITIYIMAMVANNKHKKSKTKGNVTHITKRH
jgi:hypothetical protein